MINSYIFIDKANNHLQVHKCKKCSNSNILKDTNKFICDAIKIHDNIYDYSLVNYINALIKIKILCKEHGEFEQTPNKHLLGNGCPKCAKNSKKNIIYYIDKFNKIYDNKYIYEDIFITSREKIKILCKEHGYFQKTISQHLSGQGCLYCGYKMSSQDFINKSNKIHNFKYDYSLVEYKNNKTKVKIKCPIHGIFETLPKQHLIGQKCKLCSNIILRKKAIERIKDNKNNGHQIIPNFNKKACEIFDKIMKEKQIYIQHAMNGGEYYINELGYWLDGYDKVNNVAYEYDEKYHFNKIGILREKDMIRENEIIKYLNCKIIRIKYDKYNNI